MILLALLLAAAPRVTYVKAGRLFDGLSESYRQNVTLRIENDRIAAVGVAPPPGASLIDLSNATVLPGLIDCHVHLEARADRFEDIWAFKTSPMSKAMVAVVHARRTLEAGFTSVRDVSSDP
ncbi:MAG TPA: amidohydrolase family protein, partial [Myxococcales bacterium]|nr:amidohydrolase family protein [Myxococcales bacterium]